MDETAKNPVAADPTAEIAMELSTLEGRTEELAAAIKALHERFALVLASQPPSNPETHPHNTECDVSRRLDSANALLREHIEEVRDITSRCRI